MRAAEVGGAGCASRGGTSGVIAGAGALVVAAGCDCRDIEANTDDK